MIVIPHNIPQGIREGTKHIVRYLQLYRGVPTIITWGTFSYSCWTNIVNWCWTIIDFYCSCIIITLCFFLFKVLKCFQLDDTTLWIVVTQVCSHIVSLSPSLSLACYTCCFYIRLQISCISFNFWKSDHCSYVLSHVTMSLQTVSLIPVRYSRVDKLVLCLYSYTLSNNGICSEDAMESILSFRLSHCCSCFYAP